MIWPGSASRERRQVRAVRPGHRYFDFCRGQGARIAPLPEVDGLDQASGELARGRAQLLGERKSDDTWTWLTFRAPDGNSHSLDAGMT